MNELYKTNQIQLSGGFVTYFDTKVSKGDTQFPSELLQGMKIGNVIRKKEMVEWKDLGTMETKQVNMEIIEWHPDTIYPNQENQYLSCIQTILQQGTHRMDRTKVGTLDIFGHMSRYSLKDGRIPLLTTKKVFLKGIVEELGWFLRGETDAKKLQEKGVHIWDGNSSRSFLDGLGFTEREEGDCGPIYGFQMRHFGADYKDCHTDYTGKGVDQIQNIVDQIQTNPTSRRIVMNLWNTANLSEMVLPPCHVLYQFFVEEDELSCILYQRSGDIGLGVPFNIASASILTHWIAYQTGKKAKEFIHMIGDTHIYETHKEALMKQCERIPHSFPKIEFKKKENGEKWKLEELSMNVLELIGYYPHSVIKMEMAV
jgi:thymidylate synthase